MWLRSQWPNVAPKKEQLKTFGFGRIFLLLGCFFRETRIHQQKKNYKGPTSRFVFALKLPTQWLRVPKSGIHPVQVLRGHQRSDFGLRVFLSRRGLIPGPRGPIRCLTRDRLGGRIQPLPPFFVNNVRVVTGINANLDISLRPSIWRVSAKFWKIFSKNFMKYTDLSYPSSCHFRPEMAKCLQNRQK